MRDALPGDMLQLRMLRLETIDFGANFHNAARWAPECSTTSSPRPRPLFRPRSGGPYVAFNDRIRLELRPFQGTLGVAPARGRRGQLGRAGRFGGNIDLKELTAGGSLFVPVSIPAG